MEPRSAQQEESVFLSSTTQKPFPSQSISAIIYAEILTGFVNHL